MGQRYKIILIFHTPIIVFIIISIEKIYHKEILAKKNKKIVPLPFDKIQQNAK